MGGIIWENTYLGNYFSIGSARRSLLGALVRREYGGAVRDGRQGLRRIEAESGANAAVGADSRLRISLCALNLRAILLLQMQRCFCFDIN